MQKTTTLTGQVTLLMMNGGKRKRANGGSSMGDDAASWTVSAGFGSLGWCSGGSGGYLNSYEHQKVFICPEERAYRFE
jgi:hypothetical protein